MKTGKIVSILEYGLVRQRNIMSLRTRKICRRANPASFLEQGQQILVRGTVIGSLGIKAMPCAHIHADGRSPRER